MSASNDGFVITGRENIEFYRLLTLRGALKLEVLGLRHSRGSVCALVKREFGFKGTKQRVLDQLCAHIDAVKAAREVG
jgi:uncharacterized protein (DUF2141 family)